MDDSLAQAFDLVPERRIASLYDVAVLYAACDLYEKYTSEFVDWDVSPEALQSMTPLNKSGLFDPEKDNSFIAVQVDLSNDEPELGDPAVVIENYTESLKYRVGHMYRDGKAGKQTDYSITNHANGKPVEEIAYDDDYGQYSKVANRFLRGRLEQWPFSAGAETVIDEDLDAGGVIEALRTLGKDTEKMDTVEQTLLDAATFEETEAMVGVKIKLSSEGSYLYPGEVPALNAVALQNRYDHIRDGLSVSNASGEGVGFISGEAGTVLGGSTGILGQYSKKGMGRFPDLDADESWRTRPLQEQQAIAVSNFGSVVDQFYRIVNSVRIYYLPYPRNPMTLDLFKRFHNEVYLPLLSADDSIAALESVLSGARETGRDENEKEIDESGLAAALAERDEDRENKASAYDVFEEEGAWLHVYGLLHVEGNPPRTFVDEPSISLRGLAELDDELVKIVDALGGSPLFGTMVANIDRLSRGQTPRRVLQGWFFSTTTAKTPDEEEDRESNFAATSDDARFSRTAKLLRGKPIAPKPLLTDYVDRIVQEERKSDGQDDEYWQWSPEWTVLEQYAQVAALERVGLLKSEIVLSQGLTNLSGMKLNGNYDNRNDRLQDFLDSHAVLDTEKARAVFLTGALIARITATQHQKSISTKMVDQHPVSSVNKRSLLRVAYQAIEKNETYEQMDNRGQYNRRYTDRLPGAMLTTDPADLDLTETEVKWLYSLGIAYGKQDGSLDDDKDQDISEPEPEATAN